MGISVAHNRQVLLIQVVMLCSVFMMDFKSQNDKEIVMMMILCWTVLTLFRLTEMKRMFRFYDLILTIMFAMLMFGIKLGIKDMSGFIIVTLIGCVMMCGADMASIVCGVVIMFPALHQLWSSWRSQRGHWYESLLCLCLVMMLILALTPNTEACEVTFLTVSMFTKGMILAYQT